MTVDELKGMRIGGLVSGGLDSCTSTHWLRAHGAEPSCFIVDLGQPDETDLEQVRQRMLACGALEAEVLPGQEALAEAGLQVIHAQAQYEGDYWNTTGIARYVTTALGVAAMRKRGIKVLYHGATGRGNDQVRFQLATNMLDPEMTVYAPWRDQAFLRDLGGREDMVKYAGVHGLPIRASLERIYSTDANFLGLTHEAGKLEKLDQPASLVTPGMGVWPWDAPDAHEIVSITWEAGRPVAINGKTLGLVEAFHTANGLAGKHGVGIGRHVVENRFVGIKSRGVYESPAMDLLGQSYEYLLQLYLDRRARELFQHLSQFVAVQIYQGYWYDLATTMALAAVERVAALVSGTVDVRLYRGNLLFEGARDAKGGTGLYAEDDASMERAGSFDHADAEGFLRVLGVPARNFGHKMLPELDRQ